MGLKEKARLYSPWVFHAHCSGCNGCGIEIAAALNPRYDPERIGIVAKQHVPFLKRTYDQMPNPKAVVAIGSCAITGGVFKPDDNKEPSYTQGGPVEKIIPVDVHVPGCAPKPEAIIDGIIKAAVILSRRR